MFNKLVQTVENQCIDSLVACGWLYTGQTKKLSDLSFLDVQLMGCKQVINTYTACLYTAYLRFFTDIKAVFINKSTTPINTNTTLKGSNK